MKYCSTLGRRAASLLLALLMLGSTLLTACDRGTSPSDTQPSDNSAVTDTTFDSGEGDLTLPDGTTTTDSSDTNSGESTPDAPDSLIGDGSAAVGIFPVFSEPGGLYTSRTKTVEITADVAAMAIDAFESWLVNRLANKIQRAVAAGIMAGTGSSQATGLSSRAADGTYTKAITYTDIMAIIAKLPTEYAAGASFVMSRASFYGNVLNIQDSSKHPIVVADVQSPAKFNILGYPVILEDGAGTDIYFGDLKEAYKFNFAQTPTIKNDESVGFRTGSTVYRAMALCDGKPTGVGIVRFTQAAG